MAIVSFNRARKHNAIHWDHLFQLKECLEYLGRIGSEVRAIVLTGEGKNFTAGIDVMGAAPDLNKLNEKSQETDPARAAADFFPVVAGIAECITALEKVRVPVIVAVHGLCLGLGNDVISAADIRICTSYSKFTIKEIDFGLASDVGVHQRLQKIVGNGSWVRELAYTGREFGADEALARGYVSKVLQTKEECIKEGIRFT